MRGILISFSLFIFFSLSLSAQNTYTLDSDHAVFNEALALLHNNNYSAARVKFEEYIKSTDNDSELRAEAYYYQAFSAMQLFHKDAEVLLKSFVENYPTNPKAMMAYFELGDFYYRQNEHQEAAEAFEKVDVTNLSKEKSFEWYFKTGYSYFASGDFENSLEKFDKCLDQDNKYQGAAAYYSAFIENKNQNYDNALEYVKIAEKHNEYEKVIPALKARAYYGLRNFQALIGYAQSILISGDEVNDKNLIELLLAEAYFSIDDYRNAYKYYKNSIHLNSSSTANEVIFRAGFSAYQSGFFSEAVDYLKKAALADNETGQSASYYLGLSYIRLDNKNYALSAFTDASRKDFDESIKNEALYYSGKLLFDLGRYNEAIDALTQYSQLPDTENRSEVNELISEAYLNTDDVTKAIQYIEKLNTRTRRVNEVYQKVTYRRATELFNAGQYFEAVQMFDRSLENPIIPELNINAWFWKGEAYSIGKRYEQAIQAYRQALSNNPPRNSVTLTKTYYGLGYAFYNTRQYSNALRNFNAYVDRVRGNSQSFFYDDALLRLADCHYATKNYTTAIEIYQRALDAGNTEADYCFYQIGMIHSILNNREKAEQNFNMVINRFDNSVLYDDALFQKSQIAFEGGDYTTAIDRYTQLLSEQPQSPFVPFSLIDRAIAYSNLNRHEASVDDYAKILEEYPKHQVANDALLGLQESLTAINRSDEFPGYLSRYKAANPEDQDLASIEFESAKNLYFSQKYELATEAFQKYLSDYPDSPFTDDVYYYLGESRYRADDLNAAINFFKEVLENPNSSWYNRALNRVALLYNLTGSYEKAIPYFRKLLRLANNRREEYDAWNGLMESYFYTNEYDSTIFFGNEILGTGGFSVNATNRAQLFTGKAYYRKGNIENALDYFINTVNTAKDVYGAEAQFLIAEIMHQQQDYSKSNEALYNLNENFGMYEEWVGRSFLLIAENFIQMDELFQAKATLNSVIEKSPVDEIVSQAKSKLEELQEEEESKILEDTTELN